MLKGKKLVAGVMTFAMLLGVGSSLSPVDAMNQLPDTGKKGDETGQVFDVYLHGFMGGSSSLSTMMQYSSKSTVKSSTDKKVVSKKYKLPFSGQAWTYVCDDSKITKDTYPTYKYKKGSRKSYDVVFADNTGTVLKQVAYIDRIVSDLTSKGAKVNLIGHSMGGLSATYYVTHKQQNMKNPSVNKLVTIGSPLNGAPLAVMGNNPAFKKSGSSITKIVGSKTNVSFALRDLTPESSIIKNLFTVPKSKWNSKIDVLSVHGGFSVTGDKKDATPLSDGVVSTKSALALMKHVPASNFDYVGSPVNHVSLMHYKEVAKNVNIFLNN